jgi:hypothetical protein
VGGGSGKRYHCLSACWPQIEAICHGDEGPLFAAVAAGDVEELKRRLADVLVVDEAVTPTNLAAEVKRLLADVAREDHEEALVPTNLAAELKDLLADNEEGDQPSDEEPTKLRPTMQGETLLMMASRLGVPAVVSILLEVEEVRSTIDSTNRARQYQPTAGRKTYHPGALHYAIVGWFEQVTGARIDGGNTQIASTMNRASDRVQYATPEMGVNHSAVVELLLAAGASPFSGEAGATPLLLAIETGFVEAAQLLLLTANCEELDQTDNGQAANDENPFVHTAVGALLQMPEPCRELLRSHAEGEDRGRYRMFGLSIYELPAIQAGICTRAEVFERYFERFVEMLNVLIESGFQRCEIDVPPRMNPTYNVHEEQEPRVALGYVLDRCDYKTAAVLLENGADAFGTDELHPLVHDAAKRGCHQIVVLLLEAAAKQEPNGAVRMSEMQDTMSRNAEAVALDNKSKCYLKNAKQGILPAAAADACNHLHGFALMQCSDAADDNARTCKTESLGVFGVVGEQGGTAGDGVPPATSAPLSPNVVAASILAAAAHPATELETTGMGWRRYKGVAPLMSGMKFECEILQIEEALTQREFFEQVRSLNQPVLLKGAALRWKAMEKWTFDYLTAVVGDSMTDVSAIPYGKLDGVASKMVSIKQFLYEMRETVVNMTTGLPPDYVFDTNQIDLAPSPKEGLAADVEFPSAFEGAYGMTSQLIIGPEASGAPVHYHGSAFNAAIVGRKRWFLYPQSISYWSKKPTLAWLLDGDAHGAGAGEQPLECIQHPGDVMYVPTEYGHAVINVEDSIAFAQEVMQVPEHGIFEPTFEEGENSNR